jgi:hypothetical protein
MLFFHFAESEIAYHREQLLRDARATSHVAGRSRQGVRLAHLGILRAMRRAPGAVACPDEALIGSQSLASEQEGSPLRWHHELGKWRLVGDWLEEPCGAPVGGDELHACSGSRSDDPGRGSA